MTKQGRQDVAELAARLARYVPNLGVLACADAAITLCQIEKAQRTDAINRCNQGDDYDNGRAFRRVLGRLKAWQARYGLGQATIELQGDPRGAVLKIQLPGASEAVAV